MSVGRFHPLPTPSPSLSFSHSFRLLLLSSLYATPSRAQDVSYASMGTITRTPPHDASSRGPVVVQIPLQIDGREADLTLHSEDEPMDVLRAYVADNRLDPTAAGQVKERFLEVLRDLGAVPLVSVELVFTGAGVERSIPPKLIHVSACIWTERGETYRR